MIRRRLVDVVAGGGKPPLQPFQQVGALLLGELHLLHVLVQGSTQLLHLPIPLVGHLLVQEHHGAVGWEIRQQLDERRPLSLVQLEDVQIRNGNEGMLRHHRHGLRRLRQLLHCQPLAAQAVVIKFLEPAGDQELLQLLHHILEEIPLLAIENIQIGRYPRLDGGAQRLIAAVLPAAFLFCHISLLRLR